MTSTVGSFLTWRRRAARMAIAVSALVAVILPGVTAPAGAATPQYQKIVAAIGRGQIVGCADVTWAASQGLLDPVEVHWLDAAGVRCERTQFVVLLALAGRQQLTCADLQWNAAWGTIGARNAADLAARLPGCTLSVYARLVTIMVDRALRCIDVAFARDQGQIGSAEAGWLAEAITRSGLELCVLVPPGSGSPTNRPPVRPSSATVHTSASFTDSLVMVEIAVEPACTDPDGDPLTYFWTTAVGSINGNGLKAVWAILSSGRQIPHASVVLTCADPQGARATLTMNF